MTLQAKAVSAPGKVLLAGGYLVLDQRHTGLVFGLDARIHVHVQNLPTSEGVSLQEIVVKSPQFRYATWRYGYYAGRHGGGVQVTQLTAGSPTSLQSNPFVETALSYALTYIATLAKPFRIEPASITILADNDYYSQSTPGHVESTEPNERGFQNFNTPLWEAHKTGLGSSAALVTALIAAVLLYYLHDERASLSTDEERFRLHNLAQAAHSAAQGKVGSGFDVASAVFGSCLYRRFSPSLIESLGHIGSHGFDQHLKDLIEDTSHPHKWDVQVIKSKVSVPAGLRLVMCDVDCGSNTPGMVKKVLEWRKRNVADANRVWTNLQTKNDELAAELVRLAESSGNDYKFLRRCVEEIRSLVREMSSLSGVPIEPREQTDLLDACARVPGVIGGVVPGAGGYDAIALLVEDKAEVISQLEDTLDGWKFRVSGAEDGSTGKVRLLGVREEMEGVREERNKDYGSWVDWAS